MGHHGIDVPLCTNKIEIASILADLGASVKSLYAPINDTIPAYLHDIEIYIHMAPQCCLTEDEARKYFQGVLVLNILCFYCWINTICFLHPEQQNLLDDLFKNLHFVLQNTTTLLMVVLSISSSETHRVYPILSKAILLGGINYFDYLLFSLIFKNIISGRIYTPEEFIHHFLFILSNKARNGQGISALHLHAVLWTIWKIRNDICFKGRNIMNAANIFILNLNLRAIIVFSFKYGTS
ncbi:hypothetical protein ACJX0J_035255 [Zea mays]